VMAGSTVLKLSLFVMSQVSHVLVQYITVSIKFLLAIFKEYAGNVIIGLHCMHNKHIIHHVPRV